MSLLVILHYQCHSISQTMKHTKLTSAIFSAVIAASALPVFAGESVASSTSSSTDAISSNLIKWWKGDSGTANWFGLGYPLKDYGLTISGSAKETYLGQATPAAYAQSWGGKRNYAIPTSTWGNEIKLGFNYDFGKVLGLTGFTVQSDWRYRELNGSQNCNYPGYAAGTTGNSSMFNPDKDTSGMGVRIMSQYFQYSTDTKSKDPRFLLKLGWINPYEDFLTQPESKNFENNAIASAKGIGGACYGYQQVYNGKSTKFSVTGVPWSSSYDTWGGMVRLKPSAFTYFQTFFGAAIAGESGSQTSPAKSSGAYNNHGFCFQGTASFQPKSGAYGQTGVYNVNEFGWMPKFGDAKLEGRYAIGNYIWGQNNNDYGSHSGNCTISGLYIQADQRLTAVKTGDAAVAPQGKNPVDTKNPVPATPASYDKTRGLYSFTMATFTPADACSLPFYFQTGLVYKGLFEARKNDKTGIVWGEGFYSQNLNSQISSTSGGSGTTSGSAAYKVGQGNGLKYGYASQNYSTTGVFEYFYDIAINKWLNFVPDAQYIINPGGNGYCGNAFILGATIQAKF
jgi:porin